MSCGEIKNLDQPEKLQGVQSSTPYQESQLLTTTVGFLYSKNPQ